MGILWDKQGRDGRLSSHGNSGILGSQFDPEKSYLHQMFLLHTYCQPQVVALYNTYEEMSMSRNMKHRNPWPDEPFRIDYGSPEFTLEHGGERTKRVLHEAQAAGYFDCPDNMKVSICLRVSFQEAGEFQHNRTAWHYDRAYRGWVYIDGESPAEVMVDAKEGPFTDTHKDPGGDPFNIEPIPKATWVGHALLWHRCPVQAKAGWRYFIRVLWSPSSPSNKLTQEVGPVPRREPREETLKKENTQWGYPLDAPDNVADPRVKK